MEWGAILIPLIAAAYIYKFYDKKVVIGEFVISMAIPVVMIFVMKIIIEKELTRDKEYWTGYMVSCSYEEPWNEFVSKTCTRTVGSGKNRRTETYDCSYVRSHPAEWSAKDSNGISFEISPDTFESLASRWKNRTFVDMNRRFHTVDGDAYVSTWDNDPKTLEVVTTTHSYENKVQASDTIVNFPEVDPSKYGLYEYPKIGGDGYECPSILGACPRYGSANFALSAANAALGKKRQIRMWMLIFDGKPLEAAIEQESYWKGGNKNELVVCVGVKDGKVSWCYVFSWTPREDLKISIRDAVSAMDVFDAEEIARVTVSEAEKKWERKQFAEFDYLSVRIGGWKLALIYLIVLVSTVGLFAVSVTNNIDEDPKWSRNRRRWWRCIMDWDKIIPSVVMAAILVYYVIIFVRRNQ